jgi:hypothetical protein
VWTPALLVPLPSRNLPLLLLCSKLHSACLGN